MSLKINLSQKKEIFKFMNTFFALMLPITGKNYPCTQFNH